MIFEAAMTKDDVMQGEKRAEAWGVVRRCAMIFLTKSSTELEDSSVEFAEATMAVAESVAAYLKWREHETELLQAAEARMLFMVQGVVENLPDDLEADQST